MPQFKAPNGLLIDRIFEKVPCAVGITDIAEDGQSFTYDGNGADMWWDDQYSERNKADSSFIFIDEDGDQWTFDQLTKVDEEAEEEEDE